MRRSSRCCRSSNRRLRADAKPRRQPARFSKEYFGSLRSAHAGGLAFEYPSPRPAGGGCALGRAGSGSTLWRAFLGELVRKANSNGRKPLPWVVRPAKKGRLRRKDHNAERVSKWRWCRRPGILSEPLGLGQSGGSTLLETTLEQIAVPRRRGRPREEPLRINRRQGLRQAIAAQTPEAGAASEWSARTGATAGERRRWTKLRRYRRRWKVERTFAWLGNFRRLVVRWDRSLTIYSGFFMSLAS